MPKVTDVVQDVRSLLYQVDRREVTEDSHGDIIDFEAYGERCSNNVRSSLLKRGGTGRKEKVLYASEAGKPCTRQLWYKIRPEMFEKEGFEPQQLIKFSYGDSIEELVLALCEAANHDVTHRQAEAELVLPNGWKVRGRTDALIDGALVDVKSASGFAFKKFVDGSFVHDDPFGYMTQIDIYYIALEDQITDKDNLGFLVINKENGNFGFFSVQPPDEAMKQEILGWLVERTNQLEKDEVPPRAFEAVPEGKSGNMKLPTACSYCPYKFPCWADANGGKGLRVFMYSGNRPMFLTEVVKEPKVEEVTHLWLDTEESTNE